MSNSIPGAVFSSLIFHLKNAPSDAEGFLYGSVRRHHIENITDSQSSGTREEKRVYVESFVCFSERFKFYDHYGRPHSDRIHALLGEDAKRVIGWFSYRRNTSHRLSMREKVIHRRLTECFSDIESRDFLFGLVTEQVVDGSTVHSTDYSFYNWIGTSLKVVKVNIVNLQVSATVPYQLFPIAPTPPSLPHYSSTLQQHRSKFSDSDGCMVQAQMSEQLYKAILERLKPLCDRLSEASAAVDQEAREIEQLEKQLQQLTPTASETREADLLGLQNGDRNIHDGPTSATIEHIECVQVAPLIDFEGEPTVTSSSQHNGAAETVIDLTDMSEHLSDRLFVSGDVPLIDLPNDTAADGTIHGLPQKSLLNSDWSANVGREEEVEGGEEGGGNDDMLSISGSQQELF